MANEEYDFSAIKDLDGITIADKVKKNEITIPPAGPDREKFIEIAQTKPESSERGKYYPVAEPIAPIVESINAVPAVPAPVLPETDPLRPEQKVEVAAQDLGGYKTIDELKKAHDELRVALLAKEKEVTSNRSANGRLGTEIKALKEQLTKAVPIAPQSPKAADTLGAISVPSLPDPDAFPDGVLDDGFKAATKKFNVDLKLYNEHISKILSAPPAREALPPEIDELRELANTIKSQGKQKETDEAWNNLWKDVDDFRDHLGVKLSVPIATVNQQYSIIKNPSGYSPELVASANVWYDGLPSVDREFFENIAGVVNGMYDFSSGLPVKAGYNKISAYVVDNSLDGQFGAIKNISVSQSDKERNIAITQRSMDDNATIPPAKTHGGLDEQLSSSSESKIERFTALTKLRSENPKIFNAGPLFEEFEKLRAEVLE